MTYTCTPKGYKHIERDDPDPYQRTHCADCGAFIARAPTEPPHLEWIVFEEIEGYTLARPATPQEKEAGQAEPTVLPAIWTCRACGREHTADEMWLQY